MGINDNGHVGLMLPVKAEADIQLFDGDPIYRLEGGKDILLSDLLKMDMEALGRLGPLYERREDRRAAFGAGLQDAHLGLMLEPVNQIWVENNHNTITQLGLNGLADKIIGSAAVTLPAGMKVGSSSTAASTGDTDILGDIASGDASDYQAFSTDYPQRSTATATWRSNWAAGEATYNGLQEVVMKSADGSTDAISRITFTSINKGASDTLQITINWAMSEA